MILKGRIPGLVCRSWGGSWASGCLHRKIPWLPGPMSGLQALSGTFGEDLTWAAWLSRVQGGREGLSCPDADTQLLGLTVTPGSLSLTMTQSTWF